MFLQQNVPLANKTTMRIGGTARAFAQLKTKEEVEQACAYALEEGLPMIVLGGGSNTIFAQGEIDALVVRLKHDAMTVEGGRVTVGAGKILAMLINELAAKNLDLSPLTGIPGTVGGAIYGNAGQGYGGIWIDHFVCSVTFYHGGSWQTWNKGECAFRYRESAFKDMTIGAGSGQRSAGNPPVIWEVELEVPSRPQAEVMAEVEKLLHRRIETQPHLKTAGSCFKSLPDGTPAWKLIDAVGLRGKKFGGIEISEKHANFLLNVGEGTFDDAITAVEAIRKNVPQIADVEMRFVRGDGTQTF
ncbi:MAG: UDP-N-acetylmuramate dehydrogenase [Candidatus Peregrinibacteria bacterium Gr01-1014_25]|nr:MAG: UDP-N-acetylmuramate dehydrogenase [Candidatus Peregrinibacteria bacterium Gr01-1014_25]